MKLTTFRPADFDALTRKCLDDDREANPTPLRSGFEGWALGYDEVDEYLFCCRTARTLPERERTPEVLDHLGLSGALARIAAVALRTAEDVGLALGFEAEAGRLGAAIEGARSTRYGSPHEGFAALRLLLGQWVAALSEGRGADPVAHPALLYATCKMIAQDLGLAERKEAEHVQPPL